MNRCLVFTKKQKQLKSKVELEGRRISEVNKHFPRPYRKEFRSGQVDTVHAGKDN